MNLAVVCSNVGFKGLGISHNEGILMADNSTTFANSVVAILQSEELRKKLGETGGQHVRNTFSWSAVSNQLLEHFNSIKK
jgi:glycosyltransferase involved in cell wall biosynthesis